MKNKIINSLITLVLLLSLCSCGQTNVPQGEKTPSDSTESLTQKGEENSEAHQTGYIPDLAGNWAQKGEENSETYQAGYIDDEKIELFWVTDNGESYTLYWSGTYTVPSSAAKEYEWISVNDKTKTNSALMASTDETKRFSYQNGEIKYEVTAFGQTKEVILVPTETDYSKFATPDDREPIELVKSGYSAQNEGNCTKVYYAVQIHNPNAEHAVRFPKIQITLRSEEGKILKTEEQVLMIIAADDTIFYGDSISYEGNEPATVDISVSNGDEDYIRQNDSEIVKRNELQIANTSEFIGDSSRRYTGELTNSSAVDLDSVCIVVIFKNGDDFAGGIIGFADDVKSGTTHPFEVTLYSKFDEYDSYEIYALQW